MILYTLVCVHIPESKFSRGHLYASHPPTLRTLSGLFPELRARFGDIYTNHGQGTWVSFEPASGQLMRK